MRPLKRMQEVCWERPPMQPVVLFWGWKPVLLGGVTSHNQSTVTEEGMASLVAPRWLVNTEDLILAALKDHNDRQGSKKNGCRFHVNKVVGMSQRRYGNQGDSMAYSSPTLHNPVPDNERFLGWKDGDVGPQISENPMDAIAIPQELTDAVSEFQRWKQSEQWFRDRQIPWRRGWLLYGRPGSGKTSLVRALAQEHDLPVWVFDLASLSNEEMSQKWREMQENAPCIALFEDIDTVFNGRENVTGERGGGLTYDCFLNCLSGIETADGVFNIVTTNRVEMLDEALGVPSNGVSSRPGRLDRAIKVPNLDEDCRRKIAQRILSDWPDAIKTAMEHSEGYTGAQMTELCVKEALQRYWSHAD